MEYYKLGFGYFPGLKATAAYANSLGLRTDARPHPVKIGHEFTVGHVVGVADAMAEVGAFAADIAFIRHRFRLC